MKKRMTIIVAVSLICLIAAGGTVAWLTDKDEAVNTFAVGKIDITLTEPAWPGSNTLQKLYPGAVIGKDPTVTVEANSENCFVYVLIENELNGTVPNAVTLDIDTVHWNLVKKTGNRSLYVYCSKIESSPSPSVLEKIFSRVTVDENVVTETNISLLNSKTIKVRAYAHQSEAISADDVKQKAIAFFEMA